MPSCQELEPLFAAYVDGEGTADQREAVQQHVERCPTCRRAVENERAIRAGCCITGWPVHALSPGPSDNDGAGMTTWR